jgi:hypothetical protein
MNQGHIAITQWGGKSIAAYSATFADEISGMLRDGRVAGVAIAPWDGFNVSDEGKLQPFRAAKIVVLQNLPDFSFTSLVGFSQLEELSFGTTKSSLDASLFPHLRRVSGEWHKNLFKNADGVEWESLRIWKYASRLGDLSDLPSLPKLRELEVTQSQIKTLRGIERYSSLNQLGLFYLGKLGSLAGIENLPIEIFSAENCKALSDYLALGSCNDIRELKLHRCGGVASLSFVKYLSKLRSFRFMNTDVLDGDLSFLTGIQDLMFTQKHHFSHTLAELQNANLRGN